MKYIGIVLIIAGLAALVYGGIRYTSQKRAVDLGAIQIDRTEHHNIPIPPLVGVVCVAAGCVLVFAGARGR